MPDTRLTAPEPDVSSLVGLWRVDPVHSSVSFSVRYMGVATVRARFNQCAGEAEIVDPAERSRVRFAIGTASVDSGVRKRDDDLRSPAFFDVSRYPEIVFASTRLERHGGGWRLHGNLTIRDVTRPVKLDMTWQGEILDPFTGGRRLGFSLRARVRRSDYGIGDRWAQLPGAGIGDMADIEIEASVLDVNGPGVEG